MTADMRFVGLSGQPRQWQPQLQPPVEFQQQPVFAGAPRQMNRPVFTYRNLYDAYLSCRKNKRWKYSALAFEINAEENLALLLEELKTRTYRPYPSVCFVTESPKPREIFAAAYRDRIGEYSLFYANPAEGPFGRVIFSVVPDGT